MTSAGESGPVRCAFSAVIHFGLFNVQICTGQIKSSMLAAFQSSFSWVLIQGPETPLSSLDPLGVLALLIAS